MSVRQIDSKIKNNGWHLQIFQRRFAPIGGCPLCFGTGVRFGLEWVSVNYWNQCPDSSEYTVWLYKWWSRNGEVGDGIQYLMRHCLLSFPDAVAALSGSPITQRKAPADNKRRRHISEPQNWKTPKWQAESEKLIQFSRSCLFGPNGKERLSYLVQERGLQIDTIRRRGLGWLPPKKQMPSKLVIPSYDSRGNLIRIRFRMDKSGTEQERYRISKGSNPKAPFPLNVASGKPII